MNPDAAADFNQQEFSVDIRLKSEQELRFRLLPAASNSSSSSPPPSMVEVMVLQTGNSSCTAEWNGSPLGVGIRYKVAPTHVRVNIFSWTGCNLKIFVPDPETFAKMEPYISSSGVVWYQSVLELHSHLHEARQHAMTMNQKGNNNNNFDNNTNNLNIGPCMVIGGGPSTGRHQLATSLANLCVRSGGGACTVVDLDPLHQSCGSSTLTGSSVGVPLTIGATVWENTRIIDDTSTAHSVSFSLACGRPFVLSSSSSTSSGIETSSSSAASLSFAYLGAVTKLLRLVRQRLEAQSSTRAGWSGTIIVLPRIENAACVSAYANLLYRVCEVARADKTVLLGTSGGSRSVLSQFYQEHVASHGTVATKNNGTTFSFSRLLRGASLSVDVQCMGASPSALVTSEMARVRLQQMGLRYLLNGSDTVSIMQVRRSLPLGQVDLAILRSSEVVSSNNSSGATNEVVSRASPEQFKFEGESRIVAFYSSLHDCTNFVQPLGYGIVELVELGGTTATVQTTMGMVQQQKSKEVIVRTGRMSLPANLSDHQGTIALVILPGVTLQL